MLRRTPSRTAVLALALAAALSGCAPATNDGGKPQANASDDSPAGVLTAYLTAISEGRASDALALVEHADESESSLLTDDVLGAATERISDVVVDPESSTLTEDGGTLAYSYSLGGETFNGDAPLFKASDGKWKVDGLPGDGSILGTLRVTAGPEELVDAATLGDEEIPLNAPQLVFPAIYAPEIVAMDGFEADEHEPIRVTGDDEAGFRVEFTADQSAIAKATSVADALVQQCAAQGNADPAVDGAGCPFGMSHAYSGTWSNLPSATCEWMNDVWQSNTPMFQSQMDWLEQDVVPSVFVCEINLTSVSFTTTPSAITGHSDVYTGYGSGQFAISPGAIVVSVPDFALIR